jgi:nucleoside-diphosphate-sugar epimerase
MTEKNVFITGVNSFIGKEIIRQCDKRGIGVTGVDITASDREGCYSADIRDHNIVDMIPENVDAIIHLAGLSRDPDCKNKGTECMSSNVLGTHQLMDAAQAKNAKQFIFASSEWVYTDFQEGVPKTEDDLVDIAKLDSEYALSKLISENNLRQKYNHGFCPVTVLRFGIVYGPRGSNFSAVEALFKKVADGEEITVGSKKTGRCFIHVKDVAEGVLSTLGQQGYDIINIQGPCLVSLGDVLETSAEILNKTINVKESAPNTPSIRLVSHLKAEKMLNWQPSVDLVSGLRSVGEFLGYIK